MPSDLLDIIGRIGVPAIEQRLTEALNAQLAGLAGLSDRALLAGTEEEA